MGHFIIIGLLGIGVVAVVRWIYNQGVIEGEKHIDDED